MGEGDAAVAGDETTGWFAVPEGAASSSPRLEDAALARLRSVRGLTATTSDVLEELGYRLAVSVEILAARVAFSRPVVGHVVTLRYLPERRDPASARTVSDAPKLAHHRGFALASTSDVLVIDASGCPPVSAFGGVAAVAALAAGIGGCIVDGGVRDLDEIAASGLPVWSRFATPITGKWRLEAAAINEAVSCGGVQVLPGDLAVADETGICFVPSDVASRVMTRVLEVSAAESGGAQ